MNSVTLIFIVKSVSIEGFHIILSFKPKIMNFSKKTLHISLLLFIIKKKTMYHILVKNL